MRSVTPKQYLDLLGRPVLAHALETLSTHPQIAGTVVALAPADPYFSQIESGLSGVDWWRADGGSERADSVLNALTVLREHADESDWVLVHDAARPCLDAEDVTRLVVAVEASGVGGILAVPVADTVKRSGPDGRIEATVSRAGLFRALTPQMFKVGELQMALSAALDRGLPVTDEASAMEMAGHRPLLISGRADNIKITEPQDLLLAAMFLQAQRGRS
jgi:2-C-methyl-D-erythritol 4-phosphate cytidylyltransferase